MDPKDVVAVDGPAASGKSVCSLVARKLGYSLLETGAIYRTAAMIVLGANVDPKNTMAVENILKDEMRYVSFQGSAVAHRGKVLGDELRRREVDRVVHHVAKQHEVRKLVHPIQREFARDRKVVAEGRDIGSVVFPDARVKIFLTATLETRAMRRWKQHHEKNPEDDITLLEVMEELRIRDYEDENRPFSPLVRLPEALYIDSTDMTKEQVVEEILTLCGYETEK